MLVCIFEVKKLSKCINTKSLTYMNVLSRHRHHRRCSVVKPVAIHITQTGLAAESDQSENTRSQCQLAVGEKNKHLNPFE